MKKDNVYTIMPGASPHAVNPVIHAKDQFTLLIEAVEGRDIAVGRAVVSATDAVAALRNLFCDMAEWDGGEYAPEPDPSRDAIHDDFAASVFRGIAGLSSILNAVLRLPEQELTRQLACVIWLQRQEKDARWIANRIWNVQLSPDQWELLPPHDTAPIEDQQWDHLWQALVATECEAMTDIEMARAVKGLSGLPLSFRQSLLLRLKYTPETWFVGDNLDIEHLRARD
ncbi:hypothetical protein JKG47_19295 [Acidithiobacillus sp. MC6.1]|nr:hypothetical protein [Acidithiobacillus sp. MC6.1]